MNRASLITLLTLAIATSLLAQQPRHTIVVSDMHMGVGHTAPNVWHPTEDFRWPQDFDAFLTHVETTYGTSVDLVLNGDTFELWQSITSDCLYDDADFGCNERDALVRFKRVADEHKATLERLAGFASKGTNQVVFVPGNHDSALLYPSVQAELLRRLGNHPRVKFAADGYWLSGDGRVYAEHGQQIGVDPNKMKRWPNAFLIDDDGSRYLQRTWGEQFVQDFYNTYETRFQSIDNIMGESNGLRYGFKQIGFLGSLRAAARFLRFQFVDSSFTQFTQGMGEGQVKNWDLARTRSEIGDALILSAIEEPELRAVFDTSGVLQTAHLGIDDFDNDVLKILCDRQSTRLAMRDRLDPSTPPVQCLTSNGGLGPTEGLGALIGALTHKRDGDLAARVTAIDTLLQQATPFVTFVYSHTHNAQAKFPITIGARSVKFANTGAWQHLVSGKWAAHQDEILGSKGDVIRLDPDLIPACYTFILVPAGLRDDPRLQRWYFNPSTKIREVSDTACD